MKSNRSEEQYQIKVNRIPFENENLYPYKKYTKNDYSQLNKIAPKNSILYKFKLSPDIIINKYHQTSNNINTNINIKPNHPENSNINNTSINNISFSGQPNNFSFNKNYENNSNENSINEKNNNDKYFSRNTDYISKSLNISDNNLNDKNHSDISSPLSSNYRFKIKEYKQSNLDYMKEMNKENYNNIMSNYGFYSPYVIYRSKKDIIAHTDKYDTSETENNLYSKYMKKSIKYKNNNSQENLITLNDLKYKTNIPSLKSEYFYNKTNYHLSKPTIESFRNKKRKEMNSMLYTPDHTINNFYENKLKKGNNNNIVIINNNENNNNNSLNIKLEYYRTKLFKEFYKHFQKFYTSYIKKEFIYFMTKLKNYKFIKKNSFIYNKKKYCKSSSTIDNEYYRPSKILNNVNAHNGFELFEVVKSASNDYNNIYNHLKKNRNIQNLKQIFNITKTLNKDNSNNDLKRNFSLSSMNNKFNLIYTPRIKENVNTLSSRRSQKNKMFYTTNSKSPTFRIGNKIIINNEISFGLEGNEKENELFRDSKKLNRKYEQIQRRKNKSKSKYKEIDINRNKQMSINRSAEMDNIRNSEEYNEFSEIRKYMQFLKFNNNKINIGRNKRKEKLTSFEEKNNNKYSNENNNCNSNSNIIYYKTHLNFHLKKDNLDKNENKNKATKIYNNNKEKEEKKEMIRKKNNKIKSNNINYNQNTKYKKVKVNINKKYLTNNQELNYKKKISNISNKNNINYNYNYKSVKSTSNNNKITNNKMNIYRIKKNNSKINNNINNNINNKMSNNINNNINYKINNNMNNNINYKINNNMNNNINYKINNKMNNNINYKINNYLNNNINNNFINTLNRKLVKDISTKDKKIHINIFYYNFIRLSNPISKKYYFLKEINNCSMSLYGDINIRRKNNNSKVQFKLSSIKEEEFSNQTSKLYDENGSLGNNTYESKKNNIIYHQNELFYTQFIDIIENIINNIYKKQFFKNIKKLNNKTSKKRINNENSINVEKQNKYKIYNKKNKFINKNF